MHACTDRLCLYKTDAKTFTHARVTAAACVGLLDVIVNAPVDVVEDAVQCGGPHGGVPYPPAKKTLLSQRKEKRSQDYTFRRQFHEKPNVVPDRIHTADTYAWDRARASLRPKLAGTKCEVQNKLISSGGATEYISCVSTGQTHRQCPQTTAPKPGELLPGCLHTMCGSCNWECYQSCNNCHV